LLCGGGLRLFGYFSFCFQVVDVDRRDVVFRLRGSCLRGLLLRLLCLVLGVAGLGLFFSVVARRVLRIGAMRVVWGSVGWCVPSDQQKCRKGACCHQ
jgi:hypothetical protein